MSRARVSLPGESLEETFRRLKVERDAKLAEAAAAWDATVAPVKAILDAMPEALKLKAEADKAYAKAVKPIWDAYDKARDDAREEQE